jgi:Transmembrane secretion effector
MISSRGATFVRVLAFFPFASAYLALLPLLARHLISDGPQLYFSRRSASAPSAAR